MADATTVTPQTTVMAGFSFAAAAKLRSGGIAGHDAAKAKTAAVAKQKIADQQKAKEAQAKKEAQRAKKAAKRQKQVQAKSARVDRHLSGVYVNDDVEAALFTKLQAKQETKRRFNPKQWALIVAAYEAGLPLHPATFTGAGIKRGIYLMRETAARRATDIQAHLESVEYTEPWTVRDIAQIKDSMEASSENGTTLHMNVHDWSTRKVAKAIEMLPYTPETITVLEESMPLSPDELAQIRTFLDQEITKIAQKHEYESTGGKACSTSLHETAKAVARSVPLLRLRDTIDGTLHDIALAPPSLKRWVVLLGEKTDRLEAHVKAIQKMERKGRLTLIQLKRMDLEIVNFTCATSLTTVGELLHPSAEIGHIKEASIQIYRQDLEEGGLLYDVAQLVVAEIATAGSIKSIITKWAHVFDTRASQSPFTQAVRERLQKEKPYHKAILDILLLKDPDLADVDLIWQTLEDAYRENALHRRIDLEGRLNTIIHMIQAAENDSETIPTHERALTILKGFDPSTLPFLQNISEEEEAEVGRKRAIHRTQVEMVQTLYARASNAIDATNNAIRSSRIAMTWQVTLADAIS